MQESKQQAEGLKMRILVIEDTRKHLDDANEFFATHPEVQIRCAYTFDGAMTALKEGKVDGVISDIYFPTSSMFKTNIEAGGVVIALICREKGIPCVLNTAGWHHGSKYQWIHHLAIDGFFPYMVDASSPDNEEGEAETKNWKKAFRMLSELITESAKSLATESS